MNRKKALFGSFSQELARFRSSGGGLPSCNVQPDRAYDHPAAVSAGHCYVGREALYASIDNGQPTGAPGHSACFCARDACRDHSQIKLGDPK